MGAQISSDLISVEIKIKIGSFYLFSVCGCSETGFSVLFPEMGPSDAALC